MTTDYPFSVDAREFAGKRILVTGGTKGLGAAIARRFLLSGATVATTARSPSADIKSILFIQADSATAPGARRIIDRIQEEWGGVDILVNNVGSGLGLSGGFESVLDESWQAIFDINFMSAVRLDRAFVPGMVERKSGGVIHIGTLWARLPQPDANIAYSAAKGALRTYSKGLAKAVAPHGVRVNMVSPGFFETESAHDFIGRIAARESISEDAARQQLMARGGGIPLGRVGRPAEIAETVALLASDRAGFATGQDILLDGGVWPSI